MFLLEKVWDSLELDCVFFTKNNKNLTPVLKSKVVDLSFFELSKLYIAMHKNNFGKWFCKCKICGLEFEFSWTYTKNT